MELVFYLTLLLVASLSRGLEDGMSMQEEGERENDSDNENALESFGTPVFGPNFNSVGFNGKSGYNTPALPASYSTYLGNPYSYSPYSRYNALPYVYSPSYGYGASLLSNSALTAALVSGLGYGSPYVGRSVYRGLGYGYPGYLRYRYLPEALKREPAPVVRIVASVPRAAPSVSVSAPVPAVPAAVPAVPAIPASDPVVVPYRPYRAVRGKDGVVRYEYAP